MGTALTLTACLSGCGKTYYETGNVHWGTANPMVTTASVRTILQQPGNFNPYTGLNQPTTIVCASCRRPTWRWRSARRSAAACRPICARV